MTDYFALLDEPRRPWIDADALKKKFQQLSVDVHPDRIHTADESQKRAAHDRYTQLNVAFQCLREPRDRLRHLLELETGKRPVELQAVSSDLMDLFSEIAMTCRDADAFLAEKEKTLSPMLQVQLLGPAQNWIERLNTLKQRLTQRRDDVLAELRALDLFWTSKSGNSETPSNLPIQRVEEIYRLLAFYDRWLAQIQERSTKLLL